MESGEVAEEEGETKDEEMKEEEVKKEDCCIEDQNWFALSNCKVKQEVKDEDDGLGDEAPKAELTDAEEESGSSEEESGEKQDRNKAARAPVWTFPDSMLYASDTFEKLVPTCEQQHEEVDWTAEDDETWDAENDRDYYAALELGRAPSISSSRVRAAYHKLVQRWHPYNGTWHLEGDTADDSVDHVKVGRRAALRRFWAISEAYLVLADPERRRIYDECGFKGLKQSESCYAESVFEKDADCVDADRGGTSQG
eukprot:s999_g22.t1